ncbi:MAG: hypothetical protein ABH879_04990 [archaeon]
MLEETLRSFNFDPDTEDRVRRIIDEFELEERIEKRLGRQQIFLGIRGQDRVLADALFTRFEAGRFYRDYIQYAEDKILHDDGPESQESYLSNAQRRADGTVVFITGKGTFLGPLYRKHQNLKRSPDETIKTNTPDDILAWLRTEAHEDSLADYAMGLDPTDRRPVGEVACGFYRDYIRYAEAKILHDEVPESQEWYIRNAQKQSDGTVVPVPEKGTYFNPLYQKHNGLIHHKNKAIRNNTPDDVLAWLRSEAHEDGLADYAMALDPTDRRPLDEVVCSFYRDYIRYAEDKILQDELPESQESYLYSAQRRADGTVVFITRKGTYFNPLYQKHNHLRRSRKKAIRDNTPDDIFAWLRSEAHEDGLADYAMSLDPTDRRPLDEVVCSFYRDYILYAEAKILQDEVPESQEWYMLNAQKQRDGTVVSVPEKGTYKNRLYGKHNGLKHHKDKAIRNNTPDDVLAWLRSEAHEDGLADYAMSLDPTDRRPLDEVARGFYRDYIRYAEAKILHDEVPESQEWYLRNAQKRSDGTVVPVPEKGTYYNSLYGKHHHLKRSKKKAIKDNTPDDIFAWLRSEAHEDSLADYAMSLDPTDRRPLDEVACGFYRDYIRYAEDKILHDEEPESQEYYLHNAQKRPDRTVVFVSQEGTYRNKLCKTHQTLKHHKDETIRNKTPDDVLTC